MSKSIVIFSATTTPDGAVIHDGAGLDPDWVALAARQQYLEETLHGITRRLFEVGLTLSMTAGMPPDDLRKGIDEATWLLDDMLNEIREAMFRGCPAPLSGEP